MNELLIKYRDEILKSAGIPHVNELTECFPKAESYFKSSCSLNTINNTINELNTLLEFFKNVKDTIMES